MGDPNAFGTLELPCCSRYGRTRMADIMHARQTELVLESTEVRGWNDVYLLGCIDRRVTLYSQQVRALNLAAALVASKRVRPRQTVLVVGAGAGGLTCAAGLHRLGVRVKVLERAHEVMPLFQQGANRWMHPRVYDWPHDGWESPRAALPVLDWGHALVGDVRSELLEGWAEFDGADGMEVLTGVTEVALGDASESERTVTWSPKGRMRPAATILAVGFGLEVPDYPEEKSYWENDDLDNDRIDARPRRWLVSGCGDGGLTDLLRLRLRGFQHDQMLERFTQDPRMAKIREEILHIESDPAMQDRSNALHDAYMGLDAPWVIDRMKESLRPQNTVFLASATADFLNRGASVLNRFLAAQLYHAGGFELRRERVKSVIREGKGYVVHFDSGRSEPFDRVVRRHGPHAALATFDEVNTAVDGDRAQRRSKPTSLDQTRTPLWEDAAFGNPPPTMSAHTSTREGPYLDKLRKRLAQLGVKSYITAKRAAAFRWPTLFTPPTNRAVDPFSDDVHPPSAFGDARELLSGRGDRVVLVAGAGLGKSTLLEALALELAARGSVPVIVPLPAFGSVAKDVRLIDFVASYVREEFQETLACAELLKHGRLTLLLDGLDELPSKQRGKVTQRIHDLSADEADARWIVALRDPALALDVRARELWLLPIDEFHLVDFFAGYLPALVASEVVETLRTKPGLLAICRIPLFATLLAGKVSRDGLAHIPSGPHVLLTELVDFMLDASRNRPDATVTLGPGVLRRAAERLAHAMLARDLVSTDASTARRMLDRDDDDVVLDELVQTGLLNRGHDVRFALPTVQEYLAGSHIVDRDRQEILQRLTGQVSRPWGQALQFALVARPDCGALMREILSEADDVFGSRVRMCGRIVSWGGRVDDDARRELGDRLGLLFRVLPEALYSLRDEVKKVIAGSFSAPLPRPIVELLATASMGYDVDELLECGDDDMVVSALERTLDTAGFSYFRAPIVSRLEAVGVRAIDVILRWARSEAALEARPRFRFVIGALLSQLARPGGLRDRLDAELRRGALPQEIAATLRMELGDEAERTQTLLSTLHHEGGGFFEAQKRLWSLECGEALWRTAVLDARTSPDARRRLLVHAIDKWDAAGRSLLGALIDDLDAPALIRVEARAALAIRGDAEAFARLTDALPSCELDVAKMWGHCLGRFDNEDAARGIDMLLGRHFSASECRELVASLSFSLRHHTLDIDLDGTGSGIKRERPHSAAARLSALELDLDSMEPLDRCQMLATLVDLGAATHARTLAEFVRELWSAGEPHEPGSNFSNVLSFAIQATGDLLGRPLLEDMVGRASWNIATAAIDALSLPLDDLDRVLGLHNTRQISDGLLLGRIHRAAMERGREITPDLLGGSAPP